MIPFLLHHANRCENTKEFYAIKNKLLDAHGETVGYDIQHIEGKICHSCNGTGIYRKRDQYGFWNTEGCWHCYGGWYKRPIWVFLARRKFGKYIFHKPLRREYGKDNPFFVPNGLPYGRITGYVSHRTSKYGELAVLALYLIYNRAAAKQYFHDLGMGWRCYWWLPRNYIHVIAHFVRKGFSAYPFWCIKQKIKSFLNRPEDPSNKSDIFRQHFTNDDPSNDLPF